MKLLVNVKIAQANARNTEYIPVVVDAEDGGDAQRQAIAVAQKEYPHMSVGGGTVQPATADAVKHLEEASGRKALYGGGVPDETRIAPQVGVKRRGRPPKAAVEGDELTVLDAG